jgi:ribosome-binding factor A
MLKRPLQFDRHDRATSLIKEVVASYIQREANTNPLITVTSATISPDYKRVTIFFTTIPDGRENDALIFLQRNAKEIRHYLMQKTRLKTIPHLEFSVDYGERHRQHIDEIVRDNDLESTLPEENKPTK